MNTVFHYDPTGCIHCQAGSPALREIGLGTVTAMARVCPQCALDAYSDGGIAAAIISATMDEATKPSPAQLANEQIEDALSGLYQSDSIYECREILAYHLTLIFGDEHQAAAEAVAQQLTTRILRGMEVECVGSVPGSAIDAAMGEFR